MLAGPAQRNTITANVSSYAGQTVYLVFRHHNTFDQNWIMLDDILISTSNSVLVQTLVNTPTQYQALVPGAELFMLQMQLLAMLCWMVQQMHLIMDVLLFLLQETRLLPELQLLIMDQIPLTMLKLWQSVLQ